MSDTWLVPFTTKSRSWSGGFGFFDTGDCCVCEGSRDTFPDAVAAAVCAQAAWVTALSIQNTEGRLKKLSGAFVHCCTLSYFISSCQTGAEKPERKFFTHCSILSSATETTKYLCRTGQFQELLSRRCSLMGSAETPTETARTRHFRQSRRGTGSRIV